jgi:hypothetical protein
MSSQGFQEVKNILLNHSRSPQADNLPPPAYTQNMPVTLMASRPAESFDYDGELSPILISISSPITIVGHCNLVAIDPAETATDIAKAVASAIKEASISGTGLPMIDEEGRPRPIEVRVDAAIKVEGTRNTIGKEAVLKGLEASFNELKRRREHGGDRGEKKKENEEAEEGDGERVVKKQRLEEGTTSN